MINIRIKSNNTNELIEFLNFFTNENISKNSNLMFFDRPSKMYKLKNGSFKVFIDLGNKHEIAVVKHFNESMEKLQHKYTAPKKRGRKPKI